MRWLHTGGIFAGALSDTTPELVIEAVQAAKQHGTIVSYDLNYRPSLWKSIGGQKRAREVNREIAPHVDVMLGNEEDFTACLGFEVEGADENLLELDVSGLQEDDRARRSARTRTSRSSPPPCAPSKTATRNDWGAICWRRPVPRSAAKSRTWRSSTASAAATASPAA